MRSNLLTAAIALVLLCSVAGCDMNTAGDYNDTREQTASERSVIERDGVYNGEKDTGWNRQIFGYGDGYSQSAQDTVNDAKNNNTLREDFRDAGEKAKDSIEDTTRDIANGAENTTRDIANGAKDATRDMTNGVRNAARDTKNAIEDAAR